MAHKLYGYQFPHFLLFDFIVSILNNNENLEFKNFLRIEQTQFTRVDYTHYLHLLDEIIVCSNTSDLSAPQKIIFGKSSFADRLVARPHLIPIISTDFYPSHNNAIRKHPNIIRKVRHRMDYTDLLYLPILNTEVPARENPEKSPSTESLQVLITSGKYEEAIEAASSYLVDYPKQFLFYLYRAIAEGKLKKIADGISDCTAALEICKSFKEAQQLRASFWLELGEVELAISDLLVLIDKNVLQKTLTDNHILNFNQLWNARKLEILMEAYHNQPKSPSFLINNCDM